MYKPIELQNHRLFNGDSAEILKQFPDNYFHGVVTDPPHGLGAAPEVVEVPVAIPRDKCAEYGIDLPDGMDEVVAMAEVRIESESGGFMGADWDRLPGQDIWDEVYRTLRPGGHVWLISSDRAGAFDTFYRALRRAGFEVEEQQLIGWLTLSGFPKPTEVSKTEDKRAIMAWVDYVGADISPDARRKVASVAINTDSPSIRESENDWSGAERSHAAAGLYAPAEVVSERYREGAEILSELMNEYWPEDPDKRREHWEACVEEGIPEDWDCSLPPGVRTSVGSYRVSGNALTPCSEKGGTFVVGAPNSEAGDLSITRPSTPFSMHWDGWKGSKAPLKPMVYWVLHACKPFEGSYADCARKWGAGPLNIAECAIPCDDESKPRSSGSAGWSGWDRKAAQNLGRERKYVTPLVDYEATNERFPGNLLSYSDLLRSLQAHSDIDAWAQKIGLTDEAVPILDTGLCYAPKPSNKEKGAGVKGEDNNHPTTKPLSLLAYYITLSTQEGARVLDPFNGSGSTGVAAAFMGREYTGIELNPDYVEISQARIQHVLDRGAICYEEVVSTDIDDEQEVF